VGAILVTGGAGFVGAALVEALAARGDDVAVFDLQATPALTRLLERFPGIRFFPGDLVEWPRLLEAVAVLRPETIIHCAAVVGVANGLASPLSTMRVNVEGALAVFAAMRLFDVPRLVNLSSEEIYGAFDADIIDETHPCRPIKPYGISKYAVEQLARDFAEESGREVLHVRTWSRAC
jgi:UDP-glucose 4-epimerase